MRRGTAASDGEKVDEMKQTLRKRSKKENSKGEHVRNNIINFLASKLNKLEKHHEKQKRILYDDEVSKLVSQTLGSDNVPPVLQRRSPTPDYEKTLSSAAYSRSLSHCMRATSPTNMIMNFRGRALDSHSENLIGMNARYTSPPSSKLARVFSPVNIFKDSILEKTMRGHNPVHAESTKKPSLEKDPAPRSKTESLLQEQLKRVLSVSVKVNLFVID